MAETLKVYLDTSVLIPIYIQHEPDYNKFKKVIDECENRKIQGIVSNLVLAEFTDVIRKRCLEHQSNIGPAEMVSTSIISNTIKTTVQDTTIKVTRLIDSGILQVCDPVIPAGFLKHVYDVGKKVTGVVKDNKNTNNSYSLTIVGQNDIQHALIAKMLKVDKLITFDTGFADLRLLTDFKGLHFDIR